MPARKNRNQRRKATRPVRPNLPPASSIATSADKAVPISPVMNLGSAKQRTGDKLGVRAVEAALGNRVTTVKGRTIVEATTSGIPLSAVPHFISDLRRILLIGGFSVFILFAIGIFILPKIVALFPKS